MPKKTFFKLNDAKRKLITDAFMHEFSNRSFDQASISSVVKTLRISKGSIYQYFEDKLDLVLYLKDQCEAVKLKYIIDVKRENYVDFWVYFRNLYVQGVKFDMEHPLKAKLLYNIGKSRHTPDLQEVFEAWKSRSLQMLGAMIKQEVDRGNFHSNVSIESMAYFLYSISSSIGDYMADLYAVDFDKNIKANKPLSKGHKKLLLKSIDELIILLKKAFNK